MTCPSLGFLRAILLFYINMSKKISEDLQASPIEGLVFLALLLCLVR